ncbi:MAG: protein phosphatase 2C domain-containing protein [Clostridiales bacterium]|nr:protein phosphatase 2C domain-containing protein [Clostridiales bacterium]
MRVTAFTHGGSFPVNEDYIDSARQNGVCCFAAADGGGVGNGDIAAKIVVDTIIDEFKKSPLMSGEAIEGYFKSAQAALNEKSREDAIYDTMYASAVVLITDGVSALWGNIGDCRIYRFNGKLVEEVTDDDSDAFLKYKDGKIEFTDIRREKYERPTKTLCPCETALPHIYTVKHIGARTSFLICTKGFWRCVAEEDMEEALRTSKTSKEWLSKMLGVIENAKGAERDNMSAFAVRMG